jgi:hypothetical protein
MARKALGMLESENPLVLLKFLESILSKSFTALNSYSKWAVIESNLLALAIPYQSLLCCKNCVSVVIKLVSARPVYFK